MKHEAAAVPAQAGIPARARVAVIGGGPAGLMAAEVLSQAGVEVDLFDAMPSVGRKFLLAGRGGLNLTHSEATPALLARFGERSPALKGAVEAFDGAAVRDWAAGLGIATFVGTSGRVFPTDMKAAPLLRAWLHRLRSEGVRIHARHRWSGWSEDGALRFETPAGPVTHAFDATVLALGGASWPRLGSNAAWVPWLLQRGVEIAPLRPANCGFDVAPTAPGRSGWSDHLRERFAGQPVKTVAACVAPDRPMSAGGGSPAVSAATGRLAVSAEPNPSGARSAGVPGVTPAYGPAATPAEGPGAAPRRRTGPRTHRLHPRRIRPHRHRHRRQPGLRLQRAATRGDRCPRTGHVPGRPAAPA